MCVTDLWAHMSLVHSILSLKLGVTDTPYILGHVVDRGCDTPIESFVVHSPNIGTRTVRLRRKSKLYS